MTALVAFADGPFRARGAVFRGQAEAMGVFDRIDVLDASGLPSEFLARHRRALKGRGFGYWIWKPVVIAEALARAAPGELIVYLDAGYTLNPAARARMLEYFDVCHSHPDRMLSFMQIHVEAHWTKADLAVRMGVAERADVMLTSQLSSGFILLCNTDSNRELVREWAAIAVEDRYRFSDDSPSRAPNHPLFREHRHDQSIASLLRKMRGTAISYYEVQPTDQHIEAMRARVPAWATRLRS